MATATTAPLIRLTAPDLANTSGVVGHVVGHLKADLDTLPPGFPSQLDGPLAWKATDFASESDYVLELDDADLAQLADALGHFKSLFPRPSLNTSSLVIPVHDTFRACGGWYPPVHRQPRVPV